MYLLPFQDYIPQTESILDEIFEITGSCVNTDNNCDKY